MKQRRFPSFRLLSSLWVALALFSAVILLQGCVHSGGESESEQGSIQVTFDFDYRDEADILYVNPGLIQAPTPPARVGYKLDAWYLVEDGGTTLWDFADMPIGEDASELTFRAHWSPIRCPVALNPNGGTCPTDRVTLTYGQVYTLPTPTREGYVFLGWYDSSLKNYTSGTWKGAWEDSWVMQLTAQWSRTDAYGQHLRLGHFLQSSQGLKEDAIEWIIIDEDEEGNYLVVSERILYYMTAPCNTDWENSEVRAWLNDIFYGISFTEEEQDYIRRKPVSGTDCEDWVFLLSKEEAETLLVTDDTYFALITPAVEVDTWGSRSSFGRYGTENGSDICHKWCMRGEKGFYSTFSFGSISWIRQQTTIYIRPAMWVSRDMLADDSPAQAE